MSTQQEIKNFNKSSEAEIANKNKLIDLFKNCPVPENEIQANLGLFINRQLLSRILFLNDMYKQIINVNGVIMEFGVRWGQNLSLFSSLRGLHEPFNGYRKVIGFDTFEGFPSVHSKDGNHSIISVGSFNVTDKYEEYLDQILAARQQESPIAHIKKYDIVKGDASVQVENYLNQHPETIISLAYFDMDIFEPTKKVLEVIKNYVTKGSIIGFDQLNNDVYPGETVALREVFGLDKYRIVRSPYSSCQSYLIIE